MSLRNQIPHHAHDTKTSVHSYWYVRAYCWALGRSITAHHLIGCLHTLVNVLSIGRWQLQRKASNTFSAGPAGPCNLVVTHYSAELSLTKNSFWNYVISTENNMEFRCVQTQINIILKKIIYLYYLGFDRASREGPAGPDGPPLNLLI